MSADLLREAAALMRSRAEVATQGPWKHEEGPSASAISAPMHTVSRMFLARRDAEHIASWHPAVALAVADWLDRELAAAAGFDEPVIDPAALAVARAYLHVSSAPDANTPVRGAEETP